MKILKQHRIRTSNLVVPPVKTFEVKAPEVFSAYCSWSNDTNLDDLHQTLINKIEIEFSEERTRIQNNYNSKIAKDFDMIPLISGFENFIDEYKCISDDELIELCLIMKIGQRYFWAILGHFALYTVTHSFMSNLFSVNDFSVPSLRVPGRGVGLSVKQEVCYGEIHSFDFSKLILAHGLNFPVESNLTDLESLDGNKQISGMVWLCEVEL